MKNTEYPDNFTRKRAERQRRLRKRRIITSFISIIILLLVILLILCFTIFFPIEKISITGSKIYLNEEVLEASTVKLGDNMFAFSKDNLEKEIRKELPFVKNVNVKRSLSGELSLKIEDAKESICFKDKSSYFAVGSDGFVLKEYKKQPEKLLVVKGADVSLSIGEYIKYNNESKKEILESILKYGKNSQINSIDISDEYAIYINTFDRFRVFLGTENNIKEKLAHMNSMVEKIEKNKKGDINLSHWSQEKSEGSFIESKKK